MFVSIRSLGHKLLWIILQQALPKVNLGVSYNFMIFIDLATYFTSRRVIFWSEGWNSHISYYLKFYTKCKTCLANKISKDQLLTSLCTKLITNVINFFSDAFIKSCEFVTLRPKVKNIHRHVQLYIGHVTHLNCWNPQ